MTESQAVIDLRQAVQAVNIMARALEDEEGYEVVIHNPRDGVFGMVTTNRINVRVSKEL